MSRISIFTIGSSFFKFLTKRQRASPFSAREILVNASASSGTRRMIEPSCRMMVKPPEKFSSFPDDEGFSSVHLPRQILISQSLGCFKSPRTISNFLILVARSSDDSAGWGILSKTMRRRASPNLWSLSLARAFWSCFRSIFAGAAGEANFNREDVASTLSISALAIEVAC